MRGQDTHPLLRFPRAARVLTLGLGGALAACASGDSTAPRVSAVVDTLPGGAIHVTNTTPLDGLEPRWILEPEIVIGQIDGEGPEVFGQIRSAEPLPDGRIAVLETQTQEVRIFGPDGRHERTLGGAGEGPGEFLAPNGFVVGPDGVLRVNDPRSARLSFVDPDEGFLRSVPIEVQSFGFTWGASIDSLGRIYEQTLGGDFDDRWQIIKIYDAEGAWTDTVRLEPFSFDRNADTPGVFRYERGASSVPFWPGSRRTLDPRGYFWGKRGGVNDYRIAQTTFAGDTVLVFESRRASRPVPAAARDSAIATLRERAERELDWSQIPQDLPIVESIFLDVAGRIWVGVSANDSVSTYDVYGRDGIYQGTAVAPVAIPSYWTPRIVGDRLYTMYTDELDVPYVMRARIRETGER